jgi:D-alanyl-D-alanine carboxypeptidase
VGRLAVVALVLAALFATPAAAARPLAPADRQAVDALAAQTMAQARIPGLSLLITGPKGSYTRTYGVADRSTGAPMRLADHVRIASITKTFTATAILQQVDRGRLRLSDKLASFVKGIPNGRRITIRQLLAMRSGIYDYTSDRTFLRRFTANPLLRFGPRDVIAIIRRHRPLFRPGARTSYTDSNYVLLGLILQNVTGRSAAAVITRDIIDRLRLRHTSFPTTPRMPVPFAHGYYAEGNGPIRDFTRLNPDVAWTAGGMISTLGDLRRWGRALTRGTLLSRRLQARRLRFGQIPNDGGPPLGYGLGILRFGDWIGHDGAIFGFSTAMFTDRSNGAQVLAAANLSSNFSTPAATLFALIAKRLYPASLR